MGVCIIKANGAIIALSDIVSVGVYKFEEYEITECDTRKYIVGHGHNEKPFESNRAIKPTGVVTISERSILDSLLILASRVLLALPKKSDNLILSWCKTYGLPFCSIEASQQIGYIACPLTRFRDFLFLLRDTFWKVESMYEDFCTEHDVNTFGKNPYTKQSKHFTKGNKESLVSDFVNRADLRLCFEYRNDTPTFYNYAPNIVSLATYQFALTLVSNGESVPRRCKCCGSMFFASRKNKLYGPCCNRQKRYAAEKRRREREEGVKHG